MPLNQREAIAEAIEGKTYTEWGVGGTTVWLAENAHPLIPESIEHDEGWVDQVEDEAAITGALIGWDVRHCPCTPGANATPGEEISIDADAYIAAGASMTCDVYLIDGVVRARCLDALVETGRPMVVFIHDTQRDWYDDAIQRAVDAGFVRTDYPEGEDYPGCKLTKLTRE